MTALQADESPHLTVDQLARRWHTTRQGIYNARHRGKAPKGFKRGRKLLFPIAEVEAFEAVGIAEDPKNPDLDPAKRPPEPRRPLQRRRHAIA